jgi:hypothetical protein
MCPADPEMYPECNKFNKASGKYHTIMNFIDWACSKGYSLVEVDKIVAVGKNGIKPLDVDIISPEPVTEDVLFEYFEIDRDKLDEERDRMVESLKE